MPGLATTATPCSRPTRSTSAAIPSDAGTSIGTASVTSAQVDDNDNWGLTDSSGLLKFTYSESYSSNITPTRPYYISGQLVTVNLPTWGWNNTSPYDIEFTAVSGPTVAHSPAVGTVIAAGDQCLWTWESMAARESSSSTSSLAGGSEILGHSVIDVGVDDNGNDYL